MAVYRVEDGLAIESNAASSLIKHQNVVAARWYFVTEYFESRGWWSTSMTACWVREMPGAFSVRAVLVFDPETGESQIFGEESPFLSDDGVTSMGIAARAWFDAHPVARAWHSVEPGEVWVVTLNGETETPVLVDADGYFVGTERFFYEPESDEITDGYRIWPEAEPEEVGKIDEA